MELARVYNTKYLIIRSTTVYVPSSELGLPELKGGGTLACGWGVGESQFRRREKKLSILPTLWYRSSERREWQGRVKTERFLAGEGIGVQREGNNRAEGRPRDS